MRRNMDMDDTEIVGYCVTPVFFGGDRAYRGPSLPEMFTSVEKARVFAVKVIERNKDIYTKGFIGERYRGISKSFDVEKVYKETSKGKTTYWLTREGDRKYVYRINSKTGKIIGTAEKKKN